jgi:hypothetical protein
MLDVKSGFKHRYNRLWALSRWAWHGEMKEREREKKVNGGKGER